jgi:inosine-uridine nucleoside N-ribohydrolase
MAKALKVLWKVLGVIGVTLTALAEVSPDQAASNLASWVTWLGSTHVPSWLASSRADTVAKTSGVALLLIAGAGGLMGWRSRLHKERAAKKVEQSAKEKPTVVGVRFNRTENATAAFNEFEEVDTGVEFNDVKTGKAIGNKISNEGEDHKK